MNKRPKTWDIDAPHNWIGGQKTICDACGNPILRHDKAMWTDSEESYCPPCFPVVPKAKGGPR
jgi:hypothetical protein